MNLNDETECIIAITKHIKTLIDENEYRIFVHTGYSIDQYQEEYQKIINSCLYIISNKKLNQIQKKQLNGMLQNRIKNFLKNLYNTIEAQIPLLNFVNIFIINNLICQYLKCDNIFFQTMRKKERITDYNNFYMGFSKNIKEIVDYEAALPEKIESKFKESINWLSNALFKIYPYIQTVYNAEITKKQLQKMIEKEVYENKIKTTHSSMDNELVKELTLRIQLTKHNINPNQYKILEGIEESEIKKDLSVVKSALTRTEKAINMLIDEINIA